MSNTDISDEYLTELELSELLKIPVRTIQRHRAEGTGVPFTKFGRLVRYHKDDIERYRKQNRTGANA